MRDKKYDDGDALAGALIGLGISALFVYGIYKLFSTHSRRTQPQSAGYLPPTEESTRVQEPRPPAGIEHKIKKSLEETLVELPSCHQCGREIEGEPYYSWSALGTQLPFCDWRCYDMWEDWGD